MDGTATVAELGRDGLGLIDRRLGALELFTILDHDAGLREFRLQGLRVRLGHGRQGTAAIRPMNPTDLLDDLFRLMTPR